MQRQSIQLPVYSRCAQRLSCTYSGPKSRVRPRRSRHSAGFHGSTSTGGRRGGPGSDVVDHGRLVDPHMVLGVPRHADMGEVKRAFIRLALEHHPDRARHQQHHRDAHTAAAAAAAAAAVADPSERFIQIRQAFEALVERANRGGTGARRAEQAPQGWSPEDLRDWWDRQDEAAATRDFLAFDMSDATREEVLRVHQTMAPSLHDKGGYWHMARLVAERATAAADAADGNGIPGPRRRLPEGSGGSAGPMRRRRR